MKAYFLWLIGSAVFVVFGIAALAAKKPVRFWTIDQPVQVKDVKKYNRAVAKLWFISAVAMMLLGIPLLAGQNSAWTVISVLGGMFWAIAVMAAYTGIEKKYRI